MGEARRRRDELGDDEYFRGRKRMELKFAMIADAVNESKENKLNITGEFDVIHAPKVPLRWPRLMFVARFECSITEGATHKFQVGLFDEDARPVLPWSPDLPMKFVTTGPGRPLRAQVIGELDGVTFPRFGDYELKFKVDGEEKACIPLVVRQVQARHHGQS